MDAIARATLLRHAKLTMLPKQSWLTDNAGVYTGDGTLSTGMWDTGGTARQVSTGLRCLRSLRWRWPPFARSWDAEEQGTHS